MAHGLNLHDATGVFLRDDAGHIMFAKGATPPTDGAAGYAKGCLWIDTDASAGSILLCNEGTNASCDFDAVSVA